MQKLSRFTQEKIENINKAITTKEAKSVIKKKTYSNNNKLQDW